MSEPFEIKIRPSCPLTREYAHTDSLGRTVWLVLYYDRSGLKFLRDSGRRARRK
jgi:hypothetical protein